MLTKDQFNDKYQDRLDDKFQMEYCNHIDGDSNRFDEQLEHQYNEYYS
mgnify:CR=1 FL=1